MEKLMKKAKAFVQSVVIKIVKTSVENMDISYDPEECTPFAITIANAFTKKSFEYITLIDNFFVNKRGTVVPLLEYDILMQMLLDYLYKIDDDPHFRDNFSDLFNQEEIDLMIEYFKPFPSFKKAMVELDAG